MQRALKRIESSVAPPKAMLALSRASDLRMRSRRAIMFFNRDTDKEKESAIDRRNAID
jgi:hypothetical protein